ncbi:MAG TPA: outer membrane lipoprotein-sorting protein [Myxococcota bacterium]|nr:outer membrane lipoprotein-sorting protein [Myxococcota bacterium]
MSSPGVSRAVAVLWAALAGAGLCAGAARAAGSIQEVADCATRNLPPSAHARVKLTLHPAKGEPRSVEVEYWSRTAPEGARNVVISRPSAPDDEIAAYLVSDGDAIGEAWAFARAHGTPERIQTDGRDVRLFGSNVSVEDFARFGRVLFPGQVRRLADGEVGGRKAYVVETHPSPEGGSEYSRIVTSIDKEWCMVMRRESYMADFAKGERPRKIYSVDPADVRIDAGFANAHRARLDDAKDGSSTQMEILELELPAKLDDAMFTPDALRRAAH